MVCTDEIHWSTWCAVLHCTLHTHIHRRDHSCTPHTTNSHLSSWFYPVTRPIKLASYYSTLTSNTNPTKCQLREKYVEIVAIMVRSISFGRVVNPTQPTIYKWHLHPSPKQNTVPLLCMMCVMTSSHVRVVYTHKALVSMLLHYWLRNVGGDGVSWFLLLLLLFDEACSVLNTFTI